MDALRQIVHIDMDAFYAAIEQRDNPELIGKAVIVGGDPKMGRGVVTTCSYEARKYGIHSAMPIKRAYKLCPHARFVRPRFEVYLRESEVIHEIFKKYTAIVQPLSLDEAYLDLTDMSSDFETTERITRQILGEIKTRTGLTASAGVSFNKFLAKVGSDYNKPNGITVITLDSADEFIENLPIGKFYGVGKVTKKKMLSLGITNGAELKEFGLENLKKHFGSAGEFFYNCAIGIDDRDVRYHGCRRSVGSERTLRKDIDDTTEMMEILNMIAEKLCTRLKSKNLTGRTITLRLRYNNYQRASKSITLPDYVSEPTQMIVHIKKLLDNTEAGKRKVRLLGIAVSNLQMQQERRFKQDKLKFL